MSIKKILSLTLNPVNGFSGTIQLPGSKSISNRALLLASLARGTTCLNHLLNSDDVAYMLTALDTLSVSYQLNDDGTQCRVTGNPILSACNGKVIYVGNAGTVMRFLTAVLSIQPNDVILTGDARMLERPIYELVDALRQGGARIDYLDRQGYPPLQIYGGFRGGAILLDGSRSSQFLSALLMAAPLAEHDTEITLSDKQVSQPYVSMTLNMMRVFGVVVDRPDHQKFIIKGKQNYRAVDEYFIEGDASGASYFLAGAAIKGGPVRVVGISQQSWQGDIAIVDILNTMGARIRWQDNIIECKKGPLKGIDMDLNAIPDAAMTLAVVALFAEGTTTLRNIGNWRMKECDRLEAMATELRKVGAIVIEGSDFITIKPPIVWKSAQIETYNDHRMAMCFSLIALSKNTSVSIINPTCITKTFPDYFNQFAKLIKEE